MPVIKISVAKDLNSLRRDFHQMIDEIFRMPHASLMASIAWMPAMDIYEDNRFIYVVADVAGVEADSLELAMEGQFLRVAGNRKPPVATRSKRFFQMEVEYGPFERVIRIPLSVAPDQVEARLENGLLLVRLGKKRSDKVTIEVK